ncbi:peptide/nickel transport system substrate-binding protein [Anaerovirgula multivorans]|uniref:Peptide/nickel transport system substrate-binding protein n=1 Tax=Anaerovirgula multivorans TaxID=312168 RepID=A0A239F126_9FIRM|nr:ABC transporter substrate-binding protein [Anaerovirgula multivorans]SNS50535.1 peptide/nickel transport system substrate-binding protein [Anaerovirgula multivorans]
MKTHQILLIFAIILFFSISLVLLLESPIINIDYVLSNISKSSPDYKKLIIGRANESISLDPAVTTDQESFKVTVNIYDNLVKYEKNGIGMVPSLAESWKTTEDGLIWVFRLRKNIKFHDGTNFNAHAVAFNFNRWMNSESPYHTGHFSYWNYNFGGFPGIVKSATALSDYSLEIVLTKPYAPFLSTLALPSFGIASPDAMMKYNESFKYHPIGTGPFSLKSWEMGEKITLERNRNYWGETPKLNEIEFRTIPSNEKRMMLLKLGEIHMVDNLVLDDIQKIDDSDDLRLHARPFFNIGYLALNNTKEPLNKKEVRRAIGHLIDKDDMIKEVFNYLTRPANSFLPPVVWGYNETIKSLEYDVDKAKQLLKEAGLSDGFEINLWVMDSPRDYSPDPIALAEFIKESLNKANITVNIEVMKWDQYIDRIKDGDHEMALIGWNGDNVDPDNFLYTFFASENIKPGLASNYSFYNNPQVDLLLSQARQVTDMEFRRNIYRELQGIIHSDTPSIPLVHTMPTIGARSAVKGYVPHIIGEEPLDQVDLLIE